MSEPTRHITRFGRRVVPDAAFDAWTRGSLSERLAAAQIETNGVDRHFLLLSIVGELYHRRHESPGIAKLIIKYGRIHLAELRHLLAELERSQQADWASRNVVGMAYAHPSVPSVDQLSMVLCEAGEFDAAKQVFDDAVAAGYIEPEGLPYFYALVEKRRKRLAKKQQVAGLTKSSDQ